MLKGSKLVLVDHNDKYLMLFRDNHPTFGNDPDLPGGLVEAGETSIDAMAREVCEEIGLNIDSSKAIELYTGTDYSVHGTVYSLYFLRLTYRPQLTISWEHSHYEWIGRDEFLEKSNIANDTYMHMVYDQLRRMTI